MIQFILILMGVTVCALVLGACYAYRIATKPMDAYYTWVEVVVGVGGTLLIIGVFIVLSFSWFGDEAGLLFLVLAETVFGFALTGVPMILGQVLKGKLTQTSRLIQLESHDAARQAWGESYNNDDAQEELA